MASRRVVTAPQTRAPPAKHKRGATHVKLHTYSAPLQTRKQLDSVAWDDATDDPVYDELRTASQAFRNGINQLFFDEHPQLPKLIRFYGVF